MGRFERFRFSVPTVRLWKRFFLFQYWFNRKARFRFRFRRFRFRLRFLEKRFRFPVPTSVPEPPCSLAVKRGVSKMKEGKPLGITLFRLKATVPTRLRLKQHRRSYYEMVGFRTCTSTFHAEQIWPDRNANVTVLRCSTCGMLGQLSGHLVLGRTQKLHSGISNPHYRFTVICS